MVKIALVSCGTEYSGIQKEIEKAALKFGAEIILPEIDLDYINEAYEKFGKRCGVAPYMKFGALLAQNTKKGNKGLADILKMEAIQAFENRKSVAKQKGEEASTKLLFPMFGMLAVVMVIVIIPAFLSIQI